jgi:hypothetical protein
VRKNEEKEEDVVLKEVKKNGMVSAEEENRMIKIIKQY